MTLTRPLSKLLFALGLAALAGCTPFPELSSPASEAALAQPYPDLIPLDGLNTRMETSRITPDTAPAIEARATRLRDRAARLGGPVVDPATRGRMRTGVQQ
ncbi:MAG: hypothetical protein WEB56_00365 [Roseovarius sp.]